MRLAEEHFNWVPPPDFSRCTKGELDHTAAVEFHLSFRGRQVTCADFSYMGRPVEHSGLAQRINVYAQFAPAIVKRPSAINYHLIDGSAGRSPRLVSINAWLGHQKEDEDFLSDSSQDRIAGGSLESRLRHECQP